MKSSELPKIRTENIVIQEIDQEILIYDLESNKAFCLNQTSSMVLQQCDGTKNIPEISQKLIEKLETNINEDLIWLAIKQFKANGLLERGDEFITPFDELNRREIVKRIGFSTMIAFPLITSIITPTAIYAASVCVGPFYCQPPNNLGNLNPNGCPCSVNGDCSGDCNAGICINGINEPICAPAGNLNNVSAICCPCATNGDCVDDCVAGFCAP